MKKLFDKDEIWFAITWIIIYVVGFSLADSISLMIGIPKLVTVIVGLVLVLVLYCFINKYQLNKYYGLCKYQGKLKDYLYFIPLVIISSVNFWGGINFKVDILELVLFMLSMVFVAFLEEVIFRGLLFKAMCKDNIKMAIIISSLSFGMGHIINILMGAPILDTMLQLVYASAIGYCFTVLFYVSDSIVPCIITHAIVNMLSILAINHGLGFDIFVALLETIIAIIYAIYLVRKGKTNDGIYN